MYFKRFQSKTNKSFGFLYKIRKHIKPNLLIHFPSSSKKITVILIKRAVSSWIYFKKINSVLLFFPYRIYFPQILQNFWMEFLRAPEHNSLINSTSHKIKIILHLHVYTSENYFLYQVKRHNDKIARLREPLKRITTNQNRPFWPLNPVKLPIEKPFGHIGSCWGSKRKRNTT